MYIAVQIPINLSHSFFISSHLIRSRIWRTFSFQAASCHKSQKFHLYDCFSQISSCTYTSPNMVIFPITARATVFSTCHGRQDTTRSLVSAVWYTVLITPTTLLVKLLRLLPTRKHSTPLQVRINKCCQTLTISVLASNWKSFSCQ